MLHGAVFMVGIIDVVVNVVGVLSVAPALLHEVAHFLAAVILLAPVKSRLKPRIVSEALAWSVLIDFDCISESLECSWIDIAHDQKEALQCS